MNAAQKGFTMVELITVMVVIGIVSAVAAPMILGSNSMAGPAFRSELAAMLRYAQKSAVSHRRLVCATVAANTVTLKISQTAGSAACNVDLQTPDGGTASSRDASVVASGPLVTTLYFQPSGTITTDAAGAGTAAGTIAISGLPGIAIQGATGYVE